MSDMQKFDDNIIENLLMFSFKDDEQVYTNGVELVPLFRVIQILEYFKVQELVDSKKLVKPTMLPYKGFDGDVASYQGCPNCTIPITNVFTSREYKPKFCQECGREFDWSNDE